MSARTARAIVRKDLTSFRRDKLFVGLTLAGLILYPLLFWLLPSGVNETIRIGVAGPEATEFLAAESGTGLQAQPFADRAALEAAVVNGTDDIVAGIAFDPDFASDVAAGTAPQAELLIPSGTPESVTVALTGLVTTSAQSLSGQPPPVDIDATSVTVLGDDRVGDQVSLREQLRPMLAFFILLVETIALATLVASEIQLRTVTAVLVTPATATDFLAAKGVVGTGVAFVEAAIVMALIGGLATGAPLVLLTLLFGAALVTGFGMIAGAYGKDFLGVLFLSIFIMIPLIIPALAVLFPGTAAPWVQAMPSYPLVEAIVAVTTENATLSDIAGNLALMLVWVTVVFGVATWILRRRVAAL